MAKRGAISDLNHDNWDQEEDDEEAGEFAKASDDQLKKRVIKTAKRRVIAANGGSGDGIKKSAFSGFAGFKSTTSAPGASPFSFLAAKVSSPDASTEDATKKKETTQSFSFGTLKKVDESKKPAASTTFSGFGKLTTPAATQSKQEPIKSTTEAESSGEYGQKVKELNLAVTKWIQTHVDKNPLCKLTPIFKDYEKYLKEIDDEENSKKVSKKDTPKVVAKEQPKTTGFTFASSQPADKPASSEPSGFKFGSSASVTSPTVTADKPKSTGFLFGATSPPAQEAEKPKSGLIFGGGDKPAFSFGSSTPYSFVNVSQAPAATSKPEEKTAEDDEDQPPKVEFTPVEEKDSLFSKRCKLFVKHEGSFSDRGIGTLHVKKVEDKIQLIVRADTSLGNILLNIILNDSIPTQRMGKNNVMLICIPTPDAKPPPTTILLRVKTEQEADALLKKLEEFKK